MGGKVVLGDAGQVRCHGLECQCLGGTLIMAKCVRLPPYRCDRRSFVSAYTVTAIALAGHMTQYLHIYSNAQYRKLRKAD